MNSRTIARIALTLTCAAPLLTACEPVRITSPTGVCIDGTNRCKDYRPTLPLSEPTVAVSVSGTVSVDGGPPASLIRVEMRYSWTNAESFIWHFADSAGAFSFNVAHPESHCGEAVFIRAGSGEPTIDIAADSVAVEACQSYDDIEIHLFQ